MAGCRHINKNSNLIRKKIFPMIVDIFSMCRVFLFINFVFETHIGSGILCVLKQVKQIIRILFRSGGRVGPALEQHVCMIIDISLLPSESKYFYYGDGPKCLLPVFFHRENKRRVN